jgi:hypothetical protein
LQNRKEGIKIKIILVGGESNSTACEYNFKNCRFIISLFVVVSRSCNRMPVLVPHDLRGSLTDVALVGSQLLKIGSVIGQV